MARLPILFILLFLVASLPAESLQSRLRTLFPGDDPGINAQRRMVEARMEHLLHDLRNADGLAGMPLAEQLQAITKRLESELLVSYHAGATLADAVREGTYGDATAAILYSLTLEHFNIPHEAYVDHWEAFLLVEPRGMRYQLRHPRTAGHEGQEETAFRRDYLALVRRTLAFDLTELSETESDSVFHRYYYTPGQRLTFRQLSAYQQFRLALDAYASGDYDGVNAYVELARILDDRPAYSVVERAANLQRFALGALSESKQIDELFSSWRGEPNNPYYATSLLGAYDRAQQELLTEDKLDAVLTLAQSFVLRAPGQTADWERRIRTLRQIRLMQYYQGHGKPVPALHMAETLLGEDPENPHYRDYVAELSLYEIQRNYPEPAEQVERATSLLTEYPFIRNHARYADIVLRERALTIRDHFAAGREAQGSKELESFREQLKQLGNGNDRRLWTLTAFVAASNYYFAEEKYHRALRLLDEALDHDPESDFLRHQRDLVDRY